MKKLDLPFKKIFRPKLLLMIVLFMVIGFEIYTLYTKVYVSIYADDTIMDASPEAQVVRLDLNNYNKILELLDSFKTYTPSNPVTNNPFR